MRVFAYLLLFSVLLGSGWAAWFFFGRPGPDETPALTALHHRVAGLEAAAAKGDTGAMVDLGDILARKGTPLADPKRAVALFRSAAEKGSVRGQVALGRAYADGRGVAQNYTDAARWYRVAATAGLSAEAEFALGELYFRGLGVMNDYGQAIHYYRMAAERGQPVAQYLVGVMYAEGWGVRRDPVAAFTWLTAALPQAKRIRAYDASFDPRGRREQVMVTLTETQIHEAERRAAALPHAAPQAAN